MRGGDWRESGKNPYTIQSLKWSENPTNPLYALKEIDRDRTLSLSKIIRFSGSGNRLSGKGGVPFSLGVIQFTSSTARKNFIQPIFLVGRLVGPMPLPFGYRVFPSLPFPSKKAAFKAVGSLFFLIIYIFWYD